MHKQIRKGLPSSSRAPLFVAYSRKPLFPASTHSHRV